MKTPKERAWKTFSMYIRTRDCLKTTKSKHFGICYTCGREYPFKGLECGHCISGRGNYVLLNEDLCKAQCRQCNIYKSGCYDVFVPKIIREHSLKWYEEQKRLSRLPIKKDWKEEREKYLEKYQELICSKNLPF